MSDGPGIAEILVSQLGTPHDHAAEWLGAGVVLLVVLTYLGLEYGLGQLMARCWRAIRNNEDNREGEPQSPLNPPPADP